MLVPLAILILKFSSPIIGVIFFALALTKLALELVKICGNPEKWISTHGVGSVPIRGSLIQSVFNPCPSVAP